MSKEGKNMDECKHLDFHASVTVNRLEDTGKFNADIKIWCAECELPFVFQGLRPGLDYKGATMSFDGTEARLAIIPQAHNEH